MANIITPETGLDQLAGLPATARKKLAERDVTTLAELAAKLSLSQLKQMRNIGPKTLVLLQAALSEAGLSLPERQPSLTDQSQLQQQIQDLHQQTCQLQQAVNAWIQRYQPDCWQAYQNKQPGAYADFIQAQLQALNQVPAATHVRREFEHQLVANLHRYQRQKRYAQSHEALMDSLTAQANKAGWQRDQEQN